MSTDDHILDFTEGNTVRDLRSRLKDAEESRDAADILCQELEEDLEEAILHDPIAMQKASYDRQVRSDRIDKEIALNKIYMPSCY